MALARTVVVSAINRTVALAAIKIPVLAFARLFGVV